MLRYYLEYVGMVLIARSYSAVTDGSQHTVTDPRVKKSSLDEMVQTKHGITKPAWRGRDRHVTPHKLHDDNYFLPEVRLILETI
jgi:hypothetical protein